MPESLQVSQTLPEYTVTAYNYAERSPNKMHSDDVAARYGFTGGLVPGVAVYAYMTEPIVEALGDAWLERGTMSGKFIHPVYDGETVRVRATVEEETPLRIKIELVNGEGALCGVGEATLPDAIEQPDIAQWPDTPMPAQKYVATIAALPEGLHLGSIAVPFEGAATHGEFDRFLDEVRSTHPAFEQHGRMHPAFAAAKANRLLMENVDLGPWIHTATVAQHLSLAEPGETLALRGHVIKSFERKGHEIVTLDIVVLGANDAPRARLQHTAIVKPHEQQPG